MSTDGLAAFLTAWVDDQNSVKPIFDAINAYFAAQNDVELDYKGRPGISHSLRAKHVAQKNRDLFVLVDIIDDEPHARWLSICFYADLVSDPEERGDVVPEGLMGEDACCFDIDSPENSAQEYIMARIKEAHAAAGK